MKLKILLAASGLSLCAPANAATYLITFDGTVTRGFDFTGLFGPTAADLAGRSYRVVYTLTDPLPGASTYSDSMTTFIRGGTSTGTPSPLSATITIDGTTVAMPGQTDAAAQGDDSPDALYYSVRDNSFVGALDVTNSLNTFVLFGSDMLSGPTYNPVLTYDIAPGDLAGGRFEFLTYDYNAGGFTTFTFADLTASRISISLAGAPVPEPQAWALLIVGFGLAGASMRGHRRRACAIREDRAASVA